MVYWHNPHQRSVNIRRLFYGNDLKYVLPSHCVFALVFYIDLDFTTSICLHFSSLSSSYSIKRNSWISCSTENILTMFDHCRLCYLLVGLVLVIQSIAGHKSGTIKDGGTFCANDTSIGEPNLIPIDETPARLINKVPNGTLYQIGSGEDQVWLAHVYGDTGYDFGFAYGTLLREQIHKMVPRAWAHFEQQIIDSLKDLKLPKWFEDLVVDKGLSFALDVQNDLVRNTWTKKSIMRCVESQMHHKWIIKLSFDYICWEKLHEVILTLIKNWNGICFHRSMFAVWPLG